MCQNGSDHVILFVVCRQLRGNALNIIFFSNPQFKFAGVYIPSLPRISHRFFHLLHGFLAVWHLPGPKYIMKNNVPQHVRGVMVCLVLIF
jgi:hypothetical protein